MPKRKNIDQDILNTEKLDCASPAAYRLTTPSSARATNQRDSTNSCRPGELSQKPEIGFRSPPSMTLPFAASISNDEKPQLTRHTFNADDERKKVFPRSDAGEYGNKSNSSTDNTKRTHTKEEGPFPNADKDKSEVPLTPRSNGKDKFGPNDFDSAASAGGSLLSSKNGSETPPAQGDDTSTTVNGSNMGRRGDPRMHRAVAVRLADPNVSLLDALIEGGFKFPPNMFETGNSDRDIFDSDGVQLCQRKNQLSRRLRLIRKRKDVVEKSSMPPSIAPEIVSADGYAVRHGGALRPASKTAVIGEAATHSGNVPQQPNKHAVMEFLLRHQEAGLHRQQDLQMDRYLRFMAAAGQHEQQCSSRAGEGLVAERKRQLEQANRDNILSSYSLARIRDRGFRNDATSTIGSQHSMVASVAAPASLNDISNPRDQSLNSNAAAIITGSNLYPPSLPGDHFSEVATRMRIEDLRAQVAFNSLLNFGTRQIDMASHTTASSLSNSTPHSASAATIMSRPDFTRFPFLPQSQGASSNMSNVLGAGGWPLSAGDLVGNNIQKGNDMKNLSSLGEAAEEHVIKKINRGVEIYNAEHDTFLAKCLIKAGLEKNVACDGRIQSFFMQKVLESTQNCNK
jgi:hypothetical protein